MKGYKTIAAGNVWEQTIEKSRFIGVAAPVHTAEEAEAAVQKVRLDYPHATHYVYAWRIEEGHLERSSDDGEPQGTGGKPVLELLQHQELWDAAVIVVRYFGGTLLGTGGLVRAYGGTARRLIDQTPVQEKAPFARYAVELNYASYEKVKYHLQQKAWPLGREDFGQFIRIEVYIPENEKIDFAEWLNELTNGQAVVRYDRSMWRAL